MMGTDHGIRIAAAVVAMAATASAAYGQKGILAVIPTASIAGTVVDDQGKPVDKAFVTYQREPWTPNLPGRYSEGVFTKADGSFVFAVLFAGNYRFCVQTAIQRGYVSPCAWTKSAPLAKAGDGQAVNGVKLVAERGQVVEIRVKDVKGLLPLEEGSKAGVTFQPYLRSTGLKMSHYARFQGRELTEHVYRIIVPHGVSVAPMVNASGVTVRDEVGNAVAGNGVGAVGEFAGDRNGPLKVIRLVVDK